MRDKEKEREREKKRENVRERDTERESGRKRAKRENRVLCFVFPAEFDPGRSDRVAAVMWTRDAEVRTRHDANNP